jgi:hypothetical protein
VGQLPVDLGRSSHGESKDKGENGKERQTRVRKSAGHKPYLLFLFDGPPDLHPKRKRVKSLEDDDSITIGPHLQKNVRYFIRWHNFFLLDILFWGGVYFNWF